MGCGNPPMRIESTAACFSVEAIRLHQNNSLAVCDLLVVQNSFYHRQTFLLTLKVTMSILIWLCHEFPSSV